ncbi:MAG: hypothetical protein GY870_06685 [archaeon]|nr:hypothetical protein [archaeon]
MDNYGVLFPSKKSKGKKDDRFSDLSATQISEELKWYQLVQVFIKKLNLKEDEVYELNYIHSLNWMMLWYQENKVEEAKNKNNKLK